MEHLLAFIAVALVVNLTPGPAMLHCLSTGISSGPRAGIRAALGVELGVFVYVAATVTGLSALLVAARPVYVTIQVLGIIFLLYMAWTSIPRDGEHNALDAATGRPATPRPFLRGFLLNVTNPKIAVFFLTLLPQLVPAGANSWMLLAYGLGFNLSGFTVNVTAAVAGDRFAPAVKRLGKARQILPWAPPIVFAAIALFATWEGLT